MGVIVDSSGNVFGTADDNVFNGVDFVYEIVKGSNKITKLVGFNTGTGLVPGNTLILGPGHTLFGTTLYGGPLGGGTVFKLTPL